ncbi:uncharacterized protein [Musca autumnalis]|uniref:uncharacterized protein n=1 Tax=Musca autumnalis TaxID=221902 RepID=UPI003CF1550D
MIRIRRPNFRASFYYFRLVRYMSRDLPHDPSGLLEKGRAEENIYFRRKEHEELLRMRRKLERLERNQQLLEDKLEKAQEVIEELKDSKSNEGKLKTK